MGATVQGARRRVVSRLQALGFVDALTASDGRTADAVLGEASAVAGGVPFVMSLATLAADFIHAYPDGQTVVAQQRLDLELRLHLLGSDLTPPPTIHRTDPTMTNPTSASDVADGITGAILALGFVRALHDQDGDRAHAVLVEASGIAGGVPFAMNLGALASEFIEAHPDGERIVSQQRLDLELRLHMLDAEADDEQPTSDADGEVQR